MEKIILQQLEESVQVKRQFIEKHLDRIRVAVEKMADCIGAGNKILIFGNGGSAADAQHLAAEFVNRFKIERPPLAAIALTTDTSILTSIGNDYRFDDIFSKQIEALGKKNDIAWGISTSGNSKNILQGVEAANEKELFSIGFTGRGGALAKCAKLVFAVPSDDTARIQEAHITLGHIICDLVERRLFS
ncbi:MAG: D-sedoheptulose 7-phosphate isomerase [Deltaproteobacteria bacterium]|jgi:D-sedoheptulose 7-phosphate isomerase|nr:D-sedoheptulose 7-phosphate isomerase [Deltaproteobacteria bacterium]MBW2467935.1 D-sedoheptulose 7-phosphate isomerase [Deltaproteobacteria bacterium]MBW2515950.1 D-sedoheptulose 7-phosphate isomerase [Deltaproteobacteria bacterium]